VNISSPEDCPEPFNGVYPELDEGLRTGSSKGREREHWQLESGSSLPEN